MMSFNNLGENFFLTLLMNQRSDRRVVGLQFSPISSSPIGPSLLLGVLILNKHHILVESDRVVEADEAHERVVSHLLRGAEREIFDLPAGHAVISKDFLSMLPDLSLYIMDPDELKLQPLFMFFHTLNIVLGW